MKKIVITFLFALTVPCWAEASDTNARVSPQPETIIYDATEDFPLLNGGNVPFYKDIGNGALAIDARHHEYRNLFPKAELTFSGS